MLSCKEVTRLVSESLDRDLPFSQRVSVRMHLFMCRFCSRYTEQLKGLSKAIRLRSEREEEMEFHPATLSRDARERIKRAVSGHRGEPQ